jgi:hypothetical protein
MPPIIPGHSTYFCRHNSTAIIVTAIAVPTSASYHCQKPLAGKQLDPNPQKFWILIGLMRIHNPEYNIILVITTASTGQQQQCFTSQLPVCSPQQPLSSQQHYRSDLNAMWEMHLFCICPDVRFKLF